MYPEWIPLLALVRLLYLEYYPDYLERWSKKIMLL